MEAELVELYLEATDALLGEFLRRLSILGKEGDLLGDVSAVLEGFDHLAPGGFLRVVDLAKVEDLALSDLATG